MSIFRSVWAARGRPGEGTCPRSTPGSPQLRRYTPFESSTSPLHPTRSSQYHLFRAFGLVLWFSLVSVSHLSCQWPRAHSQSPRRGVVSELWNMPLGGTGAEAVRLPRDGSPSLRQAQVWTGQEGEGLTLPRAQTEAKSPADLFLGHGITPSSPVWASQSIHPG